MTSDLLSEVTPVEFMVSPSFLVLLNTLFISVQWTIESKDLQLQASYWATSSTRRRSEDLWTC